MDPMRQSWTDDRLDDLNHRIDVGFDRVDADIRGQRLETATEFTALRGEMRDEFAAVRGEMKAEFAAARSEMKTGFEKMDARFERIDALFEKMDERFEAMHRLLVQSFVVLFATLVGLHFV